MPRDISGNYTLPAGNPVVDDTIIESTWANPTMDDIATQLNNVLTRDGLLGPLAPIKGVNGTVAFPAFSFSGDPNTGMYLVSADKIGFAVGGGLIMTLNAATSYVEISQGLLVPLGGRIGYNVLADTFTFGGKTLGQYSLVFDTFTTTTPSPGLAISGYGGISLLTGGTEKLRISSTASVYDVEVLSIAGGAFGIYQTDESGTVPAIAVHNLTGGGALQFFVKHLLAAIEIGNSRSDNFNISVAGVTGLVVAPSGYVSLPTNPCVLAYEDTIQLTAVFPTWTSLSVANEQLDVNNNFSSSTFTAPVAGVYQVTAAAIITYGGTFIGTLGVRINGASPLTAHTAAAFGASGNSKPISLDVPIQLTAGQTLSLAAQSGSGAASIDISYLRFSVRKVQ